MIYYKKSLKRFKKIIKVYNICWTTMHYVWEKDPKMASHHFFSQKMEFYELNFKKYTYFDKTSKCDFQNLFNLIIFPRNF